MANYTIVQAQLPVAGLGGHNLLVIKDPNGKVIAEVDGLATGANGIPKPMGYLPSDTLKFHSFTGAEYYRESLHQTTLFSGTYTEVMQRWAAAKEAGERINDKDLHYPFMGLGRNSNSVASTLIKAMGLEEPKNTGPALIMPGKGVILLEPEKVQEIWQHNGVSPSGQQNQSQSNTIFLQNGSIQVFGESLVNNKVISEELLAKVLG